MGTHILKTDSVLLEFDGRKILQDIYIDCRQGEVVGLLGRNGCGKSSLLRIIFGSLKASYKHISINDVPISKGYHNGRVAYLPQHNYLPLNLKISNLAVPMIDPQFWDEFSNHPIYRQYHNQKAAQLSGGELRQLETLMCIYSRADFILLDEPFTHVSPVETEMFKEIIRKCSRVKGIIVTDHQYYNILDLADRMVLITDGATKAIKTPDDLIAHGYVSHLREV
ncbi:ABC-type lipopolysaccharide export system ATPase subunit [Mucilaginibacter oryzae]|uniref:ABC-type lipopolysaccharide export system ATPase subunit n=1 Tax=Mucilaginibacter oryzae TaxID=468058 RepID=A0A316HN83_9SPHI|nr:ATP-binding cassette domain-containing protein [Mucilaginibacter oryzae]PWK79675.1 ABC-type lipopolysaccharide export system ATPase subunit [Mucilaginibacter oryzae]